MSALSSLSAHSKQQTKEARVRHLFYILLPRAGGGRAPIRGRAQVNHMYNGGKQRVEYSLLTGNTSGGTGEKVHGERSIRRHTTCALALILKVT